ncbi:MAG: DUF1491 family protein [Rhizobiales bacterium]|nr:DUF1491 family protein [Hyphomicrobiales bacterium]NRB13406.1 DUF1491 family protein [Hyphomicrobiales bacterium]
MRLKAKIIIDAELKRAHSQGLFATIINKGDESAGQIYVVIVKNSLENILIGPPFGTSFDESGEKLWQYPISGKPIAETDINQYLRKTRQFDPDIYILEIEDKTLTYRPSGKFSLNEQDAQQTAKQQAEQWFKK